MDRTVTEELSYNEVKLLLALNAAGGKASPSELMEGYDFSVEVEVMGAASWLESKGLAEISEETTIYYVQGEDPAITEGLPERKAVEAINAAGGSMEMSGLADALPGGEDKIAIGWLRRKKLADIKKDGDSTNLVLTENGKELIGSKMPVEAFLEELVKGPMLSTDADNGIVKELKGRGDMIREAPEVSREISLTGKGSKIVKSGLELKEEITDVTDRLIQSGKWKDAEFRRYDVRTFAPAIYPAKRSPITRLTDQVRQMFLDMGFTEMTSEYIQPSFWNMDMLFTPQDHPARDLQDTFYLENPSSIREEDNELVEKVKRLHEDGGDTGSCGWGGEWSREFSESAILRTHSTVSSIRYIAENPDAPCKAFSISRIFRKESIDSTHLPEFTQIEGIVIDENANFNTLISLIREFYARMGFDQVRIRPAYFPYTEPSLELEVFFNGKWMELGGAGIFRPEVVAPFGVKHPVLAWGFGFERLAMLKWNITDIRELYISDIDTLKESRLF